jgi:ADP-dependent NAD(P)H-hydrate dehydratase / NAD(P)H-hydrate epimerase
LKAYRNPPPPAPRPKDAHKASVGRVLVVGGSRDMCGAPYLAALGALRAGAGLSRAAVPREIQPIVARYSPDSLTAGLPTSRGGAIAPAAAARVRALAKDVEAVVLGPGAGREPGTLRLLRELSLRLDVPLVVDADALFAWNGRARGLRKRRATTVLTPHEGEAARLLGTTAAAVRADRRGTVVRLHGETGAIVALKGPGTLVSDGRRLFRCPYGGPALATGGTGDVLAGIIAAQLAAGRADPFVAVCQGVEWHARMGDIGFVDRGVPASAMAECLPVALSAWRYGRRTARKARHR